MKQTILSNGLSVILVERRQAPVISFNALIKVGSGCESDEEAGISHVIEHMLFKGTPSRPVGTIARDVEASGGEINAYTSLDQTVYYINMASRYADAGLDILADALQHPLFDEGELEREKEVILEEIRRGDDNPGHVVGEELFRHTFDRHSYGRPIIGFEKTVRSFSSTTLHNFYRRWYTPKNTAFIVIGDFETTAMQQKIERAFADFEGADPPSSLATGETPLGPHGPKTIIVSRHIQNCHFAFGFPLPAITSDDLPALDLLAHILGGAETSRLEQEVKEKKRLVHRIGAYAYPMRYRGIFGISGSSSTEMPEKAFRSIFEEVERLCDSAPSSAELSRAKQNLRANEIYEKETVGGEASKLAYFLATAEDAAFEEEYFRRLATVSAGDVQRVAQKYLAQEKCTSVLLEPVDGGWQKKKTAIERAVAGASPARSKGLAKRTRPDKLSVTTLPNGLTLIVEQNHQLPLFSIVLTVLGGIRFETESNNGISALLSNTVTKGTATRTALEIARDAEKASGHIGGFSGRNSFGLKGDFLSEYLLEGFSLFADIAAHPSFAKSEVKKEQHLLLQEIRNQEDQLAQLAFIHFHKALFPHHPYGLRAIGSKRSMTHLTSAQLSHSWTNTMRAKGGVLVLSGDVEPQEIADLAERLLDDLPRGKAEPPRLQRDPPPLKLKRVEVKKRGKQQAHIVVGFQGLTMKDDDRYPMLVLNNILSGQGGRLFLKLRDEMSLAYSVSSMFQPGIDPGYFAVYIGTEPKKIETAIDAILVQLKKLCDGAVAEDELHRAQQYLVGTFELEQQKNGARASNLAFNQLYGIGVEEIERYPKKILAVTRAHVQSVAQKYLKIDAPVIAVVKPA